MGWCKIIRKRWADADVHWSSTKGIFYFFILFFFHRSHSPMCRLGIVHVVNIHAMQNCQGDYKARDACGWDEGGWDFSEAVETTLGLE